MHDPLVVVFEIVRPWPSRSRLHDAKPGARRWMIRYYHTCLPGNTPATCDGCRGRTSAQMFPWWRPGSYSRFWTVAGRGWYWPAVITVWHREPGGHDSGAVCRRASRRWHVHHWRIQVPPLQEARRRLLTRCAWCGGRSRKSDPVNLAHSMNGPRGHWWQGEPGLYHHDCSSVIAAKRMCLCTVPVLDSGNYGRCAVCQGFRAWRQQPDEADRLLASLPGGSRITPEIRAQVEMAWAERRTRKEP